MESHVNVAKALNGLLQSNSNGLVKSNQSSKLGSAVQKFEAYFIQSMLKTMRSASLSTGLFESDKSNFYREWHDQQLANDLASKETFAIAKLLRQQFRGNNEDAATNASIKSDPLFLRSKYSSIGSSETTPASTSNLDRPTLVASLNTDYEKADTFKNDIKQLVTSKIKESTEKLEFSTPEKFVQQMYPYAQQAATKLNTSADVLVAIAALETGWGLHTPKANNGQDSFNYFGIKANNWEGPEVRNVTKEFDGEKLVMINDKFRAYQNPAESFNDFVNFLTSNSRYQKAVENSANDVKFISELQKAGYATDPNYAKKIYSIMDGSILKNAIESMQNFQSAEKVVSKLSSEHAN